MKLKDNKANVKPVGWHRWLSHSLWIVVAMIFFPVTQWLLSNTLAHEQLKHALLVLGFVGIVLVMERETKLKFVLEFGHKSSWSLGIAFLLAAVSLFAKWPLALVLGYGFALYAAALYLVGEELWRGVAAIVIAFSMYMFFVMSAPIVDWPLRAAAAIGGEWLLKQTGLISHLSVNLENPVKLILWIGQNPFEVAAECNGFGSMSGAMLMALLLGVYRRASYLSILGGMVVAMLFSYSFNIMRIFSICIIAIGLPPDKTYYFVMHEIVGTFFFWGCIVALWWVLKISYPQRGYKVSSASS